MGVNFCRSNLVQLEYLTGPLTQCLLRIRHVRGTGRTRVRITPEVPRL